MTGAPPDSPTGSSPEPPSPSAAAPPCPATPEEAARDPRDLLRLEQEIARYRHCENVHDLPEIYHWWSHRYVLPKLQACGFAGLDELFLHYLAEVSGREPSRDHEVVSLGAGNCDFEVRLATLAREHGCDNLRFHCVELNPHMIERGRRLAAEAGLADRFSFEVTDLDRWTPERPFSLCLAVHSLHHLVELERLFAAIRGALGDDGVFLTNDMIGRNGHMRWPEALVEVERIWRELPLHQRYNHQLQRLEPDFVNWDCAQEGNEGIRAQDILPLLLEHFHFDAFVAFGNVVDVFVDRSFGHNFDPDDADDVAWIDRIARLDEGLIDSGRVKPTHLIAAMRTRPVSAPRYYRHWTPDFCVRRPDA